MTKSKNKGATKSAFINSPLNYQGSKFGLLEQIIPLFPKDIVNFHDVFAGGASVAINVNAQKTFINDKQPLLWSFYLYLYLFPKESIFKHIDELIVEFDLSVPTKEKYLKLRSFFNEIHRFNQERDKLLEDPLADLALIKKMDGLKNTKYTLEKYVFSFFLLICYGFNNQIRFNKALEFNNPYGGGRKYSETTKEKLNVFIDALKSKHAIFSTNHFKDYLKQDFNENDFIYLDPPYLITDAAYNNDWSIYDDMDLFRLLDELNSKGVKFAYSNVLSHKGKNNTFLTEWAKQYNIHYLSKTYNRSSHNTTGNSQEILICNY